MKYARYFVTICVRDRSKALCGDGIPPAINKAWQELHENRDALTRAAVIMPDHIHWLFQLGDRLSLPRVIAKFKARTRSALAGHGVRWETNCWEHRLRPDDSIEDFGIYIFMNPYRAGLIAPGEVWPHTWVAKDFRFEFFDDLRANGAPPESWITEKHRPAGWC